MVFSQSAYGVLPYMVDWSDWLTTGDTIEAHTVTATPPLAVASDAHTDTTVVVWLNSQGCSVGDVLPVRTLIETVGGMQEAVLFRLAIVEGI